MITRDVDLEELFPINELLKDIASKGIVVRVKLSQYLTYSVQHLVIFGEPEQKCILMFKNIDIFFDITIYLRILILVTETFCFIVFYCSTTFQNRGTHRLLFCEILAC